MAKNRRHYNYEIRTKPDSQELRLCSCGKPVKPGYVLIDKRSRLHNRCDDCIKEGWKKYQKSPEQKEDYAKKLRENRAELIRMNKEGEIPL
jgi:hypothetical protein